MTFTCAICPASFKDPALLFGHAEEHNAAHAQWWLERGQAYLELPAAAERGVEAERRGEGLEVSFAEIRRRAEEMQRD